MEKKRILKLRTEKKAKRLDCPNNFNSLIEKIKEFAPLTDQNKIYQLIEEKSKKEIKNEEDFQKMSEENQNETLIKISVFLSLCGKTYTVTADVPVSLTDVESINVILESSKRNIDVSPGDILQVEQKELYNGKLSLKLRAVGAGKVYVDVSKSGNYYFSDVFYVHPTGYITFNSYFGKSNGDFVIPLAAALFLTVVLYAFIQELKANIRHSFYQYKNVTYLALIIFTSFLIFNQISIVFNYQGLIQTIRTILGTAELFAGLALPLILVVSVYVTVSNIRLMRKEGRNWRNMLGCMLGILVIAGTILPMIPGFSKT